MCHSFVQSDTPPHTNRNLKTERTTNSPFASTTPNLQQSPHSLLSQENILKERQHHYTHYTQSPCPCSVHPSNQQRFSSQTSRWLVSASPWCATKRPTLYDKPTLRAPLCRSFFLSPPLQLCDYPPSHRHAHIAEKSSDCLLIASMKRPTLRYSASSPLPLSPHSALLTDRRTPPLQQAEHVIREERLVEAYEILELMCELLAERLSLIAHDKACPPELIGSVHTLIWAAPRTEVSEFKAVRVPLLSPSLFPLLSSPPSPLLFSLSD